MCFIVATPFFMHNCCILPLCMDYLAFFFLFFFLSVLSFLFVFLVELSHCSWVTVTQGPCNVSPSFRSGHYTLLFPFRPLTIHSRYYVVWNKFFNIFFEIFFMELSQSSGITLTQSRFNVFPLLQNGIANLANFSWVIFNPFSMMLCRLPDIFPFLFNSFFPWNCSTFLV